MIEAIVKKIRDAFGDNYRIYTENVEQGLKMPCFSIVQISANGNRFLQNRYKNTHQFMVQYFPASKKAYSECSAMINQLLLLLVDVGNYHASKINAEIVDEVLNVEVVYTEFIQQIDDVDVIEDYEIKGW